jgi:hypothetical protein
MTFQFSTSIICLIEKLDDTTIGIYDQDEDNENSKESKENKELKSDFIENSIFDFAFTPNNQSSKIDVFYLISDYKTSTTITILPPEQV